MKETTRVQNITIILVESISMSAKKIFCGLSEAVLFVLWVLFWFRLLFGVVFRLVLWGAFMLAKVI